MLLSYRNVWRCSLHQRLNVQDEDKERKMIKIKRLIFLIALIVSILTLTGCEISKSTPAPKKEKASKTTTPEAAATEIIDPAKILEAYVTQTAAAMAASGTQLPTLDATAGTPLTPVDVTPTPEVTSNPALDITPLAGYVTSEPALVGTSAATASVEILSTPVVLANIPSPTAAPPPQTYTVQKGEFPYCLARRFNVNINNLLSQNGVGGSVDPGQTLKIPQDGSQFGGARALLPHPTTYTVKAGESIYTIACAFGDVDPVYLAQVNNIPAPYTLSAGQMLQVP